MHVGQQPTNQYTGNHYGSVKVDSNNSGSSKEIETDARDEEPIREPYHNQNDYRIYKHHFAHLQSISTSIDF